MKKQFFPIFTPLDFCIFIAKFECGDEYARQCKTPKSLKVKRGIEPKLDSMSIEYLDHGITIHVLNGKKRIETMEVSQQFKGEFAKGIKIGEKVSVLIDKLGVPQSIDPSIARYPEKGIHFTLKKSSLVGAHVFKK